MKSFSKSVLSVFGILAIFFCLNLVAFGQEDKAGDQNADGGSKVIRIGVLLPKVKLRDAKGEVTPEEALRNSYAVLINSDLFEVVPLDAKLTSLALAEAKKKECDYIMNVDLKQIEKKSGGGLFGRVLRDAGNQATWETSRKVPYGGTAPGRVAGSATRSTIRNTGYNMSNMAIKIKKNDKFELDYNLTTAAGDPFYSKSLNAKVKKNGDDVLNKLLEQSAEDIVKVLLKNAKQ